MRLFKTVLFAVCICFSCGLVEDSQDIPESGTYISSESLGGYISRLTIAKTDKAYSIILSEYSNEVEQEVCKIEATGKKSSYGIWVEIPAYGPRLPIIIRKRDNKLEILLKGPDDPKETFTYCLSDRSPVGMYTRVME